MSDWVTDSQTLKEMLALAIIYAPDFPRRDYLEDDEQLNLEKVFEEMRSGLVSFGRLSSDLQSYAQVLLDEAYEAYKKGDPRTGSTNLQVVRRVLIERKRVEKW